MRLMDKRALDSVLKQLQNRSRHALLGFQQTGEERLGMDVYAVDAEHGVVEEESRVNGVEPNARGDGAVGVPQAVARLVRKR